jgi:hypothetical protein
MANIIPEVTLLNYLQKALLEVKKDYNANGQNSAVVKYFEGLKIGNFDFVQEAISIFTKDEVTNQRLQVFIGFNMQRTDTSPAIHILLPNESAGRFDALGVGTAMGMGWQTIEDNAVYSKAREVKSRSFTCDYSLMITAMSSTQVVLIYHFVRSLLISLQQTLEADGLLNIRFEGQDVNLMDEFVPQNIFSRVLKMNFDYIVSAPSTEVEMFFNKLCVSLKKVSE